MVHIQGELKFFIQVDLYIQKKDFSVARTYCTIKPRPKLYYVTHGLASDIDPPWVAHTAPSHVNNII